MYEIEFIVSIIGAVLGLFIFGVGISDDEYSLILLGAFLFLMGLIGIIIILISEGC